MKNLQMSFKRLSQRFQTDLERLPDHTRKLFERVNESGILPAMKNDLPFVSDEKRFRSMEDWKYIAGDKVLITKGENKGTIATIIATHDPTNSYYLDNGPTKKVVVPSHYWTRSESSHVMDYPKSVTSEYFKLLGSVTRKGTKSYIAAQDVVFRGKYWDADYKKMLPYRCIRYREDVVIPWPKPEEVKDDAKCTSEEIAHARTYRPTSLVHSDIPTEALPSLCNNPLRPHVGKSKKYTKHIVTEMDVRKTTAPKMPLSETKKALWAERQELRRKRMTKMSPDVEEFIGKKVADHLSSVKDKNVWKYFNRVGGKDVNSV